MAVSHALKNKSAGISPRHNQIEFGVTISRSAVVRHCGHVHHHQHHHQVPRPG